MPSSEPGAGNEGDTGEAGVIEHVDPADISQSLSKARALFAFKVGFDAINDLTASQKQLAPLKLYIFKITSQHLLSG